MGIPVCQRRTGCGEKLVYAMIMPEKEGMLKVLFEPSEHMVKDFRLKAPRKVFFD